MKTLSFPILLTSAALLSISCQRPAEVSATAAETQKVALFNGRDFTGWKHHLVGENVKMEDVWSVVDGTIVCQGVPFGYLATEASYQDFTLTFEWRWAPGKEPGNSGVLLRIAGDPIGFMPKCVEAQLKHESAGDIWAFRGASIQGDAERIVEIKDHEDLADFTGVKRAKAAEKAPGEWNRYEITLKGGDLTLSINGETVNQASGLDVLSGPIGLQSEGAEIHFRDIAITPL
ncbi:MAG: 3-keto-disaccharide hydrolase [Luteolibacter sp.]